MQVSESSLVPRGLRSKSRSASVFLWVVSHFLFFEPLYLDRHVDVGDRDYFQIFMCFVEWVPQLPVGPVQIDA